MKRGTLKKKSNSLRRRGKASISKIQRKLLELCKTIIRERYKNVCYTCGKTGLVGSDWHTGHLFPKASLGAFLKYDLRVLRPQCYHCNINLGGNGAMFFKIIREVEGDEYMQQLLEDRQVTVKAYDFYVGKIAEYETLITNHN